MPTESRLDIAHWLTDHGIDFRQSRNRDGTERYTLDCPFDPSHKDAAFFYGHGYQYPRFQCFHDSCQEHTGWAPARDQIGTPTPNHWMGGEPSKNGSAGKGGRKNEDWAARTFAPKFEIGWSTVDDFLAEPITIDWLIEDVVAAGQPFLVGGPMKCLKTSILTDMALSLASGKPFLGRFDVGDPAPVGLISGESGRSATWHCLRAIAEAREIDVRGVPLHVTEDLPRLTEGEHLDELESSIKRLGLRLCIVDPAYLSMLNSGNADSAGNVFAMGSLLREYATVGKSTGCTMCLVHHFTKGHSRPPRDRDQFIPPDLTSFSQAGFAEFARQWLLLARPEPFRPRDGRLTHSLYMAIGGSAGHASEWSVRVDEGEPTGWLGKTWEVDIKSWDEAEQDRDEAILAEQADEREEQIQTVLRLLTSHPEDGFSVDRVRTTADPNGTIPRDKAIAALAELERRGDAENTDGRWSAVSSLD